MAATEALGSGRETSGKSGDRPGSCGGSQTPLIVRVVPEGRSCQPSCGQDAPAGSQEEEEVTLRTLS